MKYKAPSSHYSPLVIGGSLQENRDITGLDDLTQLPSQLDDAGGTKNWRIHCHMQVNVTELPPTTQSRQT